jgi:hypothetical protein
VLTASTNKAFPRQHQAPTKPNKKYQNRHQQPVPSLLPTKMAKQKKPKHSTTTTTTTTTATRQSTSPVATMRHPHQPDAPTPITQDDHIMLDTIDYLAQKLILCHHTPADAPIQPTQSDFWDLLDAEKPLLCKQNLPCDLTPPYGAYLANLLKRLLTKKPYLIDMLQYQADQAAGKIPSQAPAPVISIGPAPKAPQEDPVEHTPPPAPRWTLSTLATDTGKPQA